MATSRTQDASFISEVIDKTLLESSIEWIKSNLNPEEVFDESQLEKWAEENNYVEKTKD